MSRSPKWQQAIPWADGDGDLSTRWLLNTLWPGVDAFVNAPGQDPEAVRELFCYATLTDAQVRRLGDIWLGTRRQLDKLIGGGVPFNGCQAHAPMALRTRRGRTEWVLSSETLATVPDIEAFAGEVAFVLMVAGHPLNRGRVARCVYCGQYSLQKRRSTAERRFCGPTCKARQQDAESETPRKRRGRRRAVSPSPRIR
jgi:hypothetical protein